MKYLKTLRQQLGLTQEEMAMFLKTTRNVVSKIEIGQQELNHEQTMKFAFLVQKVNNNQKAASQVPDIELEELKKEFGKLLNQLKIRKWKIEKQLTAKMNRQMLNIARLKSIYIEKEKPSQQDFEKEFKEVVLSGEHKALKSMEANGANAQLMLQLEKESLQFKIERIEEWLKGF